MIGIVNAAGIATPSMPRAVQFAPGMHILKFADAIVNLMNARAAIAEDQATSPRRFE
jgi:hypothetical protein